MNTRLPRDARNRPETWHRLSFEIILLSAEKGVHEAATRLPSQDLFAVLAHESTQGCVAGAALGWRRRREQLTAAPQGKQKFLQRKGTKTIGISWPPARAARGEKGPCCSVAALFPVRLSGPAKRMPRPADPGYSILDRGIRLVLLSSTRYRPSHSCCNQGSSSAAPPCKMRRARLRQKFL